MGRDISKRLKVLRNERRHAVRRGDAHMVDHLSRQIEDLESGKEQKGIFGGINNVES